MPTFDSLKPAYDQLAKLIKDINVKGIKDVPVLHIPLHANTFPLAYVYSLALLVETGELASPPTWCKAISSIASIPTIPGDILKEKIRTEEWGSRPPKFDRHVRFNIFFANKDQINRWQTLEDFRPFYLFSFKHQFFLVESDPAGSILAPGSFGNLTEWVASLTTATSEIRIVTDIPAEARTLKDKLLIAFAKAQKTPPGQIPIVSSSERSPHNVLRWMFVDSPPKSIQRLFLFGTPLSEVLAAEKKYRKVLYGDPVQTFLCVRVADPNEVHVPVLPIYNFFKELGYPVDGDPTSADLNKTLKDISDAFRRCLEKGLPWISGNNPTFTKAFIRSIKDHSSLVNLSAVFNPPTS